MTDKTIIDRVDVLKEKINICFILLSNKLETSETIEQTIYDHLDAFVEEWNKQLKRKEEIIEKLKEKHNAMCKSCPRSISCDECSNNTTLKILNGEIV